MLGKRYALNQCYTNTTGSHSKSGLERSPFSSCSVDKFTGIASIDWMMRYPSKPTGFCNNHTSYSRTRRMRASSFHLNSAESAACLLTLLLLVLVNKTNVCGDMCLKKCYLNCENVLQMALYSQKWHKSVLHTYYRDYYTISSIPQEVCTACFTLQKCNRISSLSNTCNLSVYLLTYMRVFPFGVVR